MSIKYFLSFAANLNISFCNKNSSLQFCSDFLRFLNSSHQSLVSITSRKNLLIYVCHTCVRPVLTAHPHCASSSLVQFFAMKCPLFLIYHIFGDLQFSIWSLSTKNLLITITWHLNIRFSFEGLSRNLRTKESWTNYGWVNYFFCATEINLNERVELI